MRTDDLDFELPPELIAQAPPAERAASRLLHYRRGDRAIAHRTFSDLPALLRPGDLLVFNDARVVPARFVLRKPTGGRVEGLFIGEPRPGRWRVMLKNLGGSAGAGPLRFERAETLAAAVAATLGGGEYELDVAADEPALRAALADRPHAAAAVHPPGQGADDRDAGDQERYQTVYARTPGAVAAPTAGLHFTRGAAGAARRARHRAARS